MKSVLFLIIFFSFSISLIAQSFTVTVVPSKLTYAGNGLTDGNGEPTRGAIFILDGFIYPGDYFENNCPLEMNCGILDNGEAEDSLSIIGTWSFRGFSTMDLTDALQMGGTASYSNQIITFNDDFADCPGCTISLDGQDSYGKNENVPFKKAIVGGTTEEFRLMRGESEVTIFKQPENKNKTGGYNMLVTFNYFKN